MTLPPKHFQQNHSTMVPPKKLIINSIVSANTYSNSNVPNCFKNVFAISFFFIQYPIKVQEMYLVVMPLLFLLVQNSPAHFFKWQCLFDSILTRFINASCSESLTSSPLGWEFNFGLFFFFSSLFTLCSGQSHPGLWL